MKKQKKTLHIAERGDNKPSEGKSRRREGGAAEKLKLEGVRGEEEAIWGRSSAALRYGLGRRGVLGGAPSSLT